MRYRAWVMCVLATLAAALVQESFAAVATQCRWAAMIVSNRPLSRSSTTCRLK